ncbi:ribbon-helix-helix protein, CopG family [Candidatus Woesearchaeota archaeon]|nr:ribbon-helix-helix protein, CopG family [Candidatus Woesearchaeota archaeon]
MSMSVVPIRLPEGLVKDIDMLVKKGDYASRSDVVRYAVRKLVKKVELKDLIGIIPNTGDSVKEVREIRKRLSREIKSWEDVERINKEFEHLSDK